jgi:uncharacterized tellurite resistance protein B-like protein
MLKAISMFFDSHFGPGDDDTHSVDQLQLASAALLIELTRADNQVDHSETKKLLAILQQRFNLPEIELEELVTLAGQQNQEATSLYEFTSLINENFDVREKSQLILNMWEVAFADGRVDRYEEHLIRKVSDLLHLSHKDFITGKQVARARAENTDDN